MTERSARPTFKKAGFLRQGYSTEEVDAFLDRLFEAIATGGTVPDIVTERFTSTRSGGYDMEEVDAFLDDVTADLGQGADLAEQERAQQDWLKARLRELRGDGP